MPDEPSPDTAPPPNPDQDPTSPAPEANTAIGANPEGDLGSDAAVIGANTATAASATPVRGSDAAVIGANTASNALDLVDEVLEALDQDELARAEALAERLENPAAPDEN